MPKNLHHTAEWIKARRAVLAQYPNCVYPNCSERAAEVEHVDPLADGGAVDGGAAGLQPLCHEHHLTAARARSQARRHGLRYQPLGTVVYSDRIDVDRRGLDDDWSPGIA